MITDTVGEHLLHAQKDIIRKGQSLKFTWPGKVITNQWPSFSLKVAIFNLRDFGHITEASLSLGFLGCKVE
jgi:DNA-binding winged helix-turn-helix (wHTH) protein